ncbi:ERI1 exoribonuclease 2 isoform X2 [Arvicanthis niloticus]|nr:ERI1 exoribonuclease 2 isoform X2 [Arvicanthis niloticus]XP_034342344.1 ERI1 exoribonuclease 2 isoform X2 [Arvicanthis niloticus]XP_034342345.1 ERI1 exoribonuclease 2 isoform X2 [Arvicanthis niloticus]
MIRDGCLMKITRSLNKVLTKKNTKILARNLCTDQVEEASACNISIQGPSIYQKEPQSTVNTKENAQMNSVCVNSCVKDQLQLKSNMKADLYNIKHSLPLFTTKSSTSVEQLRSPTVTPSLYIQKPSHSVQLASNDSSKSSTLNSNLVLVSTTIPSVNLVSDVEMGHTFDCLPMLAEWEDVVLLPASQAELGADCMPPISDINVDISFNSVERSLVSGEPETLSYENFEDLKETPQNSETSKSIVYKSPHSTVYNVKGAKHKASSDASVFKLPECKPFPFTSVHANASHPSVLRTQPLLSGGTKRNSFSPPAFPRAKKQTFTIHEEKSTSSICSPGTTCKVSPSVLTSTVNLQELWKTGKMTPPLCKCGRRSKRLIVSNNGPNHGKAFYCCPVGKYQEDRKCCGYFKWEQTLQKERTNGKALPHSSKGLTFSSPETSHIHDRNLSFPVKNSLRLRPSMRH